MTNNQWVTVGEVYLKPDPMRGFLVILKEKADADQFFMMFVGESEFTAIAKEKGLLNSKRPLTHDMYNRIMDKLRVIIIRVEITELKEETYVANVIFRTDGVEYAVDCRPSDGVALALNRRAPIRVLKSLFHKELTQEEIHEYEGIVKVVKF